MNPQFAGSAIVIHQLIHAKFAAWPRRVEATTLKARRQPVAMSRPFNNRAV